MDVANRAKWLSKGSDGGLTMCIIGYMMKEH